jgi:large subunit ribosomal protein L21
MYAVAEIAGMQTQVSEGTRLRVPLLKGEAGAKLRFDRVLAIVDGANIRVGAPVLEGAAVEATIVLHGKAAKVICFKKKRRKGFVKKKGHRQNYTVLSVDKISA